MALVSKRFNWKPEHFSQVVNSHLKKTQIRKKVFLLSYHSPRCLSFLSNLCAIGFRHQVARKCRCSCYSVLSASPAGPQTVRCFTEHFRRVMSVAFSPDGRFAAIGKRESSAAHQQVDRPIFSAAASDDAQSQWVF